MANKQITNFTEVDSPVTGDFIHISRGGADRKITVENLIPALGGFGSVIINTFSNGADYIAGVDNVVGLTQILVSKNNAWVFFDGIYQNKSTYNVSNDLLTFNEIIPEGVSTIEVVMPIILPLGVTTSADQVQFASTVTTEDLLSQNIVFNNVSAMVNASWLIPGLKCRTLGYYVSGDGGGNDYEIVAAATGVDDGGSFIDLITHQAKGLFIDGIKVSNFGADLTGITDSTTAMLAARNYLAANPPVKLIFTEGIYSYTASPNWAIKDSEVIFEGDVRLRNTGTGSCVIFDSGASTALTFNIRWGWGNKPFIEGTSSSNHGVFVRSCHHCKIGANVRGCGGKALQVNFSVLSQFDITASINQGPWFSGAQPIGGIFLDRRDTLERASANIFINPIIEGINGIGIEIDHSLMNKFVGGTSEANVLTNVVCSANSSNNTFEGIDLEVPGNGKGFVDSGRRNSWIEVLNDAEAEITGTAIGSTIRGGIYNTVTNAGTGSTLEDFAHSSTSGTFTDTGTFTTIRNIYNLTTASYTVLDKKIGRSDFDTTVAVGAFAVTPVVPGNVTKIGVVVPGVRVGDHVTASPTTAPPTTFFPAPSITVTADDTVSITYLQINGAAASPFPAGATHVFKVTGV